MITKEVEFHPKQFEIFNFNTQYGAAIGGVQSGKTFLGVYWAARNIAEMPKDGVGMIIAPNYRILDQSTLVKFFAEFPQYRQFYKEQKRVILFPDGRQVLIRSADEPYSLEGITADWVWGDEAGRFNLLVWTILRSRTAIKKGKVLFTTTPYNMGWLYNDFFIPWRDKTDPDLTVVTWASVDNPYFSKEFAEKERLRLRPEEYNRRYLGEFTRMEGLVYNLHSWHIIKPFETRADITVGGIDWGFTNPAALTVCKYYDGKWYVVDEWYKTGKTTREITEQCILMQNKWGVNRWYADSANPEKILEASTNTGLYIIPYDKGRDAISAGISYIQQLLNENMFFVFNTCAETLSEFESYHYPEEATIKDQPVAEDNHLMDAIRYAIHGYQPARKFTVKIPTLGDSVERLLGQPMSRGTAGGTSYE
jgi:PBSX family phage terminase large subunit